ncbi:MAG: hypothetical protein LUG45_09265 [Clostridiales bacterium]|nr:hypothetical protein [Clostridiales bacterium]
MKIYITYKTNGTPTKKNLTEWFFGKWFVKEQTNATGLIVAIAKHFHVSTDYLLGLTPVSTQKSYDISTLGLSEEVVRRLITGRIDADILNQLLAHDKFPQLCALIRNYFDGTVASGVMARNELIDLATEPLAALKALRQLTV